MIHDVIYNELVQGVANLASRGHLDVTERLIAAVRPASLRVYRDRVARRGNDLSVPYFPTTWLHAEAVVRPALADEIAALR
ncbi:MAG: hypothetical protein R2706_14125 [Acidimicrobiales bacterium]